MQQIKAAVKVMREGGVIAYPTEGVFGLGCDPFNETAVRRLLKIKQRRIDLGLILLVSSWEQARTLIKVNPRAYPQLMEPGRQPTTWIIPATSRVPSWIRGRFNSVAIRATTHSLAKRLCISFGGPIVSTSANLSGAVPSRTVNAVKKQFTYQIDLIVTGKTGTFRRPSVIKELKTGKVVRA